MINFGNCTIVKCITEDIEFKLTCTEFCVCLINIIIAMSLWNSFSYD